MSFCVAVLMDPIESIHVEKDSSFAMLLEAQRRGHELLYLTQSSLAIRDSVPWAQTRILRVRDDASGWFELDAPHWRDLRAVDVILARKDPPFDAQYLYDTMVLELAQAGGALVVNDPRALRDANEKLFALRFPQCIPPTLVARDAAELKRFAAEYDRIVLKPLDGMGGRSIFVSARSDPNLNVILETLTDNGRQFAMAQRYLEEIRDGDKRILLIDGEAVPYALARVPQGDEFRGNLARGGKGVGLPLTERERWIAHELGPELRARGMLFVGLDVIGGFLTEVNVTSPTCIRELDAQFGLNIAGQLFDVIQAKRR
ncbi:MAG: glutathione synthase [Xanthomonadaceae bacterium]|nr:glutathione synthase [Xanthomonadaceae bacterium]